MAYVDKYIESYETQWDNGYLCESISGSSSVFTGSRSGGSIPTIQNPLHSNGARGSLF